MKRLLTFIVLSVICYYADAQTYLMSNTNVSTCGGTFYDSGGAGSNYGNNQNSTMTFCSSNAGQCISVSFTSFNLESGYDFLRIYNGPNTASPLLGTFTGTTTPGTFIGTSGCLTFVFTSDIVITASGWVANISCITCAAGGSCLQTCNGGPAPANDACSGAQNLGLLPVPAACPSGIGAWQYTNTTNLCATAEMPYTTLTGCKPSGNMASPAADVWYRFNLTGPTLNVQISGGIQTPNVALYSGTNCSNLIGRGCAIGAGGILNTSFVGLAAGTYYLQVSGGSLNDQCDFTLGLQNNYDCAGCVIVNNLTVNPPPVNGTYVAGQLVTFCYTISEYNQTSANWLHGVVPTFGSGWDMSTLTYTMPNNCSGNGTWGWYNTNVVSSATGVSHGPGFYYESPLGSPFGVADGNPGNNFGDYNPLDLCDWTFCWSIRTKPQSQCVQGASLNISIDTYGDGESGSWTSLACTGDPITDFFATSACCQPPNVNVTNPNCPGGMGSAQGTGQGTSPWTFIWKNSAGTTIMQLNNVVSSNALPNLAAGNYSLTTVDNNGCAATTYFTIAAPPSIVVSATTVATKCNRNDGAINISASGGTTPLQYSIDNGTTYSSNSNYTNLAAGSYTVVVRDANGCTTSQTVNVAPSTVPVINTTTVTGVTCNGSNNGSITVNASGGSSPYQYSLDNGVTFQSANSFSGLPAGNYSVLVSDNYGCTVTANVTVVQPPAITIASVVPSDATCGSSNGSLTINANGGIGTLQYSITGGAPYQSSNIFNNLSASNYNVVVVDANGCSATTTASINNSAAPVINSAPSTPLLCNAGTNASITINASGGTGALQYSINNGSTFQSGNVFNSLTAGSYNIVVTDAVGCQVSTSVTITDPPSIQINTSATGSTCSQSNGSLTVNALGGTGTLQYSINNGATFQPGTTFNSLTSGNYTVVVHDANGCTASVSANIPDAPAPVINNTMVTNVNCNGNNNGSINISASGGTGILVFSINNGASFQSGNNFSALAAGSYTVVVKDDNGCTVSSSLVVTEPSALSLSTVVANTTCSQANGSVTITANGGTPNYQYSIDAGSTFQSSSTFPSLATGSYTIVVQDANGCTTSSGVNITDAPGPRVDAVAVTDATCNGANNGTINITASGGTTPLQFSNTGGAPYQGSNNFVGLSPGNYTVVVVDANGCTATTSATITEPTQVVINSTPAVDATCNGANNGSISINASGGTIPLQYSINNGSSYQSGSSFSNLSPGTYQIIVQDANGCTASTSATITEPTQVVINSTPAVDVNCNGANNGSISINASGGTSPLQYSINNGSSYQSGSSFSNLSPGTYQIIVQDANGCTASTSATITEPTQVVISSTPAVDATCNGANNGSISINASGGTIPLQYSINNGSSYQSTNSFNGLAAGNYQILVQDANGCTATTSATITEPTQVVINSTPAVDATCNGANNGSISINASGGTIPLQYSINNGSSYQSGSGFSNLSPGTYQIIVQDANGCTASTSATITEPTQLVINSTPAVDVNCNGANNGSISINASGGTIPLQYSINNGSSYQSGSSFSNLSPGTYQIIVQDANGCTASTSATITEPTQVVISSTPAVDATCNGANNGSISINASGGTSPLQYSINNGSSYQSGSSFSNLSPGTYQIIVQDANGCTATTSATITEPTQVVINSTPAVHATCNGANNGSISINASGGTIPLQYSINNGSSYQSGSSFSNLSPGTYQIIVQDANGCTATTSVTITEPSAVAFTSTHTDANCGNANGTITLNGSGGTAPLQYSINNGTTFQSTGNFNSLLAGNYQIVVLDANGCSAAGSVSVQNLAAPIINSVSHTDITCNGSDNGSLVINASGGTGSLQYSIDNGNTFNAVASFNNLPPGNYLIVVQDATGCQASSSSIITEPLPLSLTPALTGTTCSNSNGSISVNAGGGTSPYQYSSNNGGKYQSSNNFSNLSSGNYNMVVQDANGCTISQSVTINDAPSPVISSINTSGLTCNNSGDGSIAIVTSAGTAPLQYSIDNGSNYQSSGNFSSLSAGSYQVLVMDANGCTASGNISLTQPSAINLSLSSTASTCGNSDGAVNASASGGTGALQYSIDNGITYQSSSTFNSLLSGNYTVIVQDANGCTASSPVAVNNQSAPVILSTPSTDITCFGADNGTITVNANGGVGILQYSVDNGNTYLSSSSFNALSPGNYSVVVQDANGCTATSSVVISEPAVIAISTNISGSVCSNANGAISVSASGGTGALQYSINNGNTFQPSGNFANIVSGNYAIVVQDANGCTMTASAVVNDAPAATILNTPVINISCNGLANGQIQINAQGGTSPLQFSVDNGSTYQSSNVFQNLAGGNYQIMVSDANGCTTTAAATISEPAPVNATAASSNANCGQADGSVTVNASGGAGALQYSIDNGVSYQSSSQFGFLTAGNYNIIIQDGNGCTASVSVTVNSNAAPVISAVSSVDITCYGTGNGSVVVTANGGTGSLQYSVDNGLTYQPTNTFNNLTPGIYAVVVMDASGCTVTSQATITEPALLTMTSGTQKSVCGLANGSITINASGGAQPLQFSIDNGSTFQPVNSFTNLNAGSYQLLVQDANGCSASSSVNVASAPSPVISNVAVTPITCSGTNNGAITVTVSGGSNPLQFSIDNGVTFQSSNNFASLTGGNYQVMVTDANGCSVSASATLSQPAPVSISATTGNANCNQADGSVTISASGGTGTLLYSIDHGVSFQSSSFFGFLPAGTYTMFVQDGNGCIDSLDAVVNNNAAPAISSVSNTDVTCNGLNNGSVTVNASGGTGMLQYSIDNGSSYQSSSVFTNVIPGSYAVVVQDGNGCTVTSSAVVTEPALLTFTSNVLGSTCGLANGSITINPSGGTLPYQFSNDNGNTFQSANQFTGLTGGSYQLLISDANGCTATSVKNVGTAPSPVINSVAHTDLSCNGSNNGTLTVSVSNGTAPLQFSSDNGITYQSNGSFTNLQAGSYQVIVQDANGCTATSGAVLTEPQAITVNTTSTDASCGSSNGTLTVVAGGGSGVLLYSVDGGVSYFSDSLFLNLLAGNYNVVVQDANGCTSSVAASVLNTSSPVLSSSPVTNVSCFGYNDGTITVNITGGSGTLTYSINGGITTQTSNVFSSLQAGNYTVIVNDAQGCSISTSVSITEPDEIIVNTATTDATCGATNGSITVNANGGAGALQYSINNGTTFQPNGNFANQGAGNYQIVVQDANGCVANDVASVSNTNAPTISSVTYTSLTCNGSNDGTINVNAAGGTGALQYSINNGQTYSAASSFNNLLQGNYAIIVLDAAGCQTTYNVLLTEPSPILFNTAITPSTCGNSNGVITFNAIGGTAPLTYSIDNGASFQSSVQFNGLNASNYGVVVQDNNGCSVNAQAVIPNQGGPAIQNIVAADVKCYGLSNGSVTVSATGGTGALQYSINNGSSFQSGNYFNNLPQANYQIVVQDANGCTATASSVIQQPAALTINAVAGGATCSNANGVINVTAAGGTGTISYSADSGITYQALSQFASVLAGNYNMVVQDSNGCKAYMAINVTDAPAPVLPPCTVSNVSCYGMSNGSITISAVGGTAPLSYSVNNGLTYQSAVLFNNLSAGNYDVVVQDANGCTVSSTEQIIQPSQINFILNASAATCGNSNGTINVISSSGGTGLYQFSIDSGLIWQSSVVFDSLGASSYSVMMQDANGCTASHVVVVPDIGGPVISNLAVTDVQCHGGNNGTIAVSQSNGTGPFQFSINNGQSYQSGNLFSGLTVGTYTMIVTDVNGCSASAPALIAEPDALVVSTSTNGAVCSNPNGSITIVASGGTGSLQYSSDNGITYQPQAGFSAVAAGTYNLIVQDANGCTVAQTVTVSDAPSPLIDSVIVSNVKCFNGNDGEVTLQTSGGTAPLTYSINGGTAQAFAQFANLSAGNYSLMVTDSNGCTQSAAASVSHPAKLNFALSAQPSTCGNNNGQLAVINVSGGTGSYSFSADSGATFQSSSQFINLASGSYQIMVMDSNGCTKVNTINVANLPGPVFGALSLTDINCFGNTTGNIGITPQGGTGPFHFSIDGGQTSQGGNVFNNLAAGNYSLSIIDNNGCQTDSIIILSEPPVLTYSITSSVATCGNSNASLTLAGSGGAGNYQYSINGGMTYQSSGVFAGLTPNAYPIVVIDLNNCSIADSINIASAPAPVLALTSSTNISCYNLSDGSVAVSASAGTSPFTYSIDQGNNWQSNAVFNSLPYGSYWVYVQDANGCQDSVSINLNQPPQLITQTTASAVLCNGGNSGSAAVTATGGTAPYSYNWNISGSTASSLQNVTAGTYTVVVTDANNCSQTDSVVVSQPALLQLSVTPDDATCFGFTDGAVTVSVNGGTSGYQYSIDGVSYQSSTVFNSLAPNSYSITVMDANGCTATATTTISQPQQIAVTSQITPVQCFGGTNGAIDLSAAGGKGNYVYAINGGVGQALGLFNNLPAGTYSILITDANGCTLSFSDSITQPDLLTTTSQVQNVLCNGQSNGAVTVAVAGGVAPYSYNWNTGDTLAAISNMPQGSYTVVVTDNNGCTTQLSATVSQPTAINVSVSPDPTICIGQQATLTASALGGTAPYVFKWNTGYVGAVLNVSPAVTTPYNVFITDNAGCNSPLRYANVFVNPPLDILVSPDDTICQGQSVTLTANVSGGNGGPYNITWDGQLQSSLSVSPSATTVYTAMVSDGCTVMPAQAQSTVVVNPLPQVNFAPLNAEGCAPLTVSFDNLSVNAVSYQWTFGDGEKDTIASAVHTYETPGIYSVGLFAVSNEGCENNMVLDDLISVYDNPIAAFDINRTETIILDPRFEFYNHSIGASHYQWNFGDNKGVSSEPNPFYAYSDTGIFNIILVASNEHECADTAYGEVHVGGAFTIYIPNAFSPNNDGRNDYFGVNGIGYTSVQMLIFDRWGNLIFNQTSENPQWEGINMFNSTQCQQGVYVYKVIVKSIFDKQEEYKGTVTLIR